MTPRRREPTVDPVQISADPTRRAQLTVLDFVARVRDVLERDEAAASGLADEG